MESITNRCQYTLLIHYSTSFASSGTQVKKKIIELLQRSDRSVLSKNLLKLN